MKWSASDKAAFEMTSREAGAHLERIGKTDLAKMTREEWMTFLEIVVASHRNAAFLDDEVPF